MIRDKVRALWCDFFGFEPTVVASFDHIGVGLLSRIFTGYEYLQNLCPGNQVISIVLDTILPRREPGCGISLEAGFMPDRETSYLNQGPEVFYYRNGFNYNFRSLHESMEDPTGPLGKTIQWKRRSKEIALDVLRTRIYWWSNHWSAVKNCPDVLVARERLAADLGLSHYQGKKVLFSDCLPMIARCMEVALADGLRLVDCPRADRQGLARLVLTNGQEGEIVHELSRHLCEQIRQGQAIPTAPIIILLATVLPGFPHFGNDYGMIPEISQWLGLEPPKIIANDNQDSWPPGVIRQKGRIHHNTFVDLLHFPREMYRTMIVNSVENRGSVFAKQFGEYVIF